MATPVVTVASGGLPVTDVTSTLKIGLPITEAANGRGTAVTKVASGGRPVVYSAVADYPSGGGGPSAQTTAFLARTSGLDTTHTNAYTALIDGLVADGIFAKLDVLHIYATQDSTTAKLNLVSSSFAAVANGSPTFTTDRGFTGVDGSTIVYLDIPFNATTAPSPKSIQNSSHVSAWSNTNTASSGGGGYIVGVSTGSAVSGIAPRFNDDNSYMACNGGNATSPSASSLGHWLATRTNALTIDTYKNASLITSPSIASTAPVNLNYAVLAIHGGAGLTQGSACQVTMASIGSGFSGSDVTSFYNRLRTYMTAVGVP